MWRQWLSTAIPNDRAIADSKRVLMSPAAPQMLSSSSFEERHVPFSHSAPLHALAAEQLAPSASFAVHVCASHVVDAVHTVVVLPHAPPSATRAMHWLWTQTASPAQSASMWHEQSSFGPQSTASFAFATHVSVWTSHRKASLSPAPQSPMRVVAGPPVPQGRPAAAGTRTRQTRGPLASAAPASPVVAHCVHDTSPSAEGAQSSVAVHASPGFAPPAKTRVHARSAAATVASPPEHALTEALIASTHADAALPSYDVAIATAPSWSIVVTVLRTFFTQSPPAAGRLALEQHASMLSQMACA
jgi:hypothetical protein